MEEFLKQTSTQIVNRLSEDQILMKLWSAGIITFDEYQEIGDLKLAKNRKEFVKVLKAKKVDVLPKFIEIVAESTAGKDDLVAFLNDAALGLPAVQQSQTPMLVSPDSKLSRAFFPMKPAEKLPVKFKVKEEPPIKMEHDECNGVIQPMVYELKTQPKGHVLIVNNILFHDDDYGQMERLGAENDSTRLISLFQGLGFNVFPTENITRQQFQSLLQDFKLLFTNQPVDACILIFMSHGSSQDRILTSDHHTIHIQADILYQFNNENFKQMIGKPKMFFFQSCRGETLDTGVIQQDSGSNPILKQLRIPTWTDMLVCYSAVEGHYSYRHSNDGSWFIQILCDVLWQYASTLDICKILNIVAEKLKAKEGDKGQKQICPWTNIGFTKEFYFMERG